MQTIVCSRKRDISSIFCWAAEKTNWLLCRSLGTSLVDSRLAPTIHSTHSKKMMISCPWFSSSGVLTPDQKHGRCTHLHCLAGLVAFHFSLVSFDTNLCIHTCTSRLVQIFKLWFSWWWLWFIYHKCEQSDQKAWKAFKSCQPSLQKIIFKTIFKYKFYFLKSKA